MGHKVDFEKIVNGDLHCVVREQLAEDMQEGAELKILDESLGNQTDPNQILDSR